MNTNLTFEKQPSAPTDEKVSNELVKQIRKLRWIGMDGEAEILHTSCRCCAGHRGGNGLNTLAACNPDRLAERSLARVIPRLFRT
jgi:hypothetical protein